MPPVVTVPVRLAVANAIARLAPMPAALPETCPAKLPMFGFAVIGAGADPKTRFERLPRNAISAATIPLAVVALSSAPAAPAIASAWLCTSASAEIVTSPAAVTVPATVAVAVSLARLTAIGVASACAPGTDDDAAASLRARTMFVATWFAVTTSVPVRLIDAPAATSATLLLFDSAPASVCEFASATASAPA